LESTASHWPRRRPEDSEIDPDKPIREVFDVIRVADPKRYPAFFRLNGHVYAIALKKVSKDESDPD
jgi:methionyl-tRNA formyltransferase